MKKNNVIITIDDIYTSIYVWSSFNNQVIPLYFNSTTNKNSIINGTIFNKKVFQDNIVHLINETEKFVNQKIDEISLCIHNFNISITNFELTIDLENKVINQTIWENDYLPKLKIKHSSSDQHIYDFNVIKWKIDGNIIEKIDQEYYADKVFIFGKKYSINKLIYDNYVDFFKNLKIKIKDFSTTLDIFKDENNTLNILIDQNSLSIASVQNKHLISNVVCEDKGIKCLINMLKKELNIEEPAIENYLKNIDFFKKNGELDVIDIGLNNTGIIQKIKQSRIDEVINEYTSIILNLIMEKIEYYKKQKNTNISTINLISNLPIVQQIFNLFLIHSKYQFNIIKPKLTPLYEMRYVYCILNAWRNIETSKLLN